MLALMRSAGSIDDRRLGARHPRVAAPTLAAQADQNSPNVRSQIESLENRVRLTRAPPRPRAAPEAAAAVERPLQRTASARTARGRSGQPDAGPVQFRPRTSQPQLSQLAWSRRSLDTILHAAMRAADAQRATGAPWDPPPTPLATALQRFQQRMMRAGRDETALRDRREVGPRRHRRPRRLPNTAKAPRS